MRAAGVDVRQRQGFPRAYGAGRPQPVAVRHGYRRESLPVLNVPAGFALVLGGQPMNSPRPRGPIVTGPDRSVFPIGAYTGTRMPGGVGTDPFDRTTWQRRYQYTP